MLYLSKKIKELLILFSPKKIPSSSKILDIIKGYVDMSPVVKIFLFATFFTSSLFCIIGSVDKNNCSCLNIAFLYCNPLEASMFSNLFICISKSSSLSEKIVM